MGHPFAIPFHIELAMIGDQAHPIVISPKTVLTLLNQLGEKLEQARESGSDAGSAATLQRCLPWEANLTRSWAPIQQNKSSR
jgi:hypothetical protein